MSAAATWAPTWRGSARAFPAPDADTGQPLFFFDVHNFLSEKCLWSYILYVQMWIGAMCTSQILVKTQRHPNGLDGSGPAKRAIPIGRKGQQQPPHGHKQQHGQNRQVYLGITNVFLIFVCECVSVQYLCVGKTMCGYKCNDHLNRFFLEILFKYLNISLSRLQVQWLPEQWWLWGMQETFQHRLRTLVDIS